MSSISLNLPIWHFWLDVPFWTIVESCLFSRSSCVRHLSTGPNRETLIAISLGMDWKEAPSSFFGCWMVNLSLSNLLPSMTWSDIGGLSLGALSPLLRLAGVTSNGLPLIPSSLNSFVTSTFVIFSWLSVAVASLHLRTVCSVKSYKTKMVISDRRLCLQVCLR